MSAGKHGPQSLYRFLLGIGLPVPSGEFQLLQSERLLNLAEAAYWDRRSVPLRAYDHAAQVAALSSEGATASGGEAVTLAPSVTKGAAA